ncbi:MAG: Hsp70 family protein [Pseudomonadota bacterium]
MARLAVDFGTSNTGVAASGTVLTLQRGETTAPTALFFDPYSDEVLFGHDAVDALIEGRDGRFLRALKSVLGQPLLRENRVLGGQRTTLLDVIAAYLAWIKENAEAAAGISYDRVLSGRPVRFHSRNPDYNAQAERDLREAYARAGFREVDVLTEPAAAALASGGVDAGHGLVVDIGGGTSDYAVFRGTGADITVVANYGIRLGGTDFDRLLNLDRVMPGLGLGTELRQTFGAGTTQAPRALFHELATWEKIPFQYTSKTRQSVAEMARQAVDRRPWRRLEAVLEHELAHEIAHAVEGAKIAANSGATDGVGLGFVEAGFRAPLERADLDRVLSGVAAEIASAAIEAVAVAGLTPPDIQRIVLVGGSSLMSGVSASIRAAFPDARIDKGDALTAIIKGLAIAASRP